MLVFWLVCTIGLPDFGSSVNTILNLDGQVMSTPLLLDSPPPWSFRSSYGPGLTLTLDISAVTCLREAREVNSSSEFELKFPKLSRAELKRYRVESSQAGHFDFLS